MFKKLRNFTQKKLINMKKIKLFMNNKFIKKKIE